MTDLDLLSTALGAIMPPVVSTVNRSYWPSWAKALCALGCSLVVGVATAWLSGQLAGAGVVRSVLLTLAASQAAYVLWWRPSGIAPAIERATNGPSRPGDPPE